MSKPSRQFSRTCPSCGREIKQHQSDLAEEMGMCPYCQNPLVPVRKYDPDSETVASQDEIDEEEEKEPPGER